MKTYRIAVQDGLESVVELLKSKGHEIVPYATAGLSADVAVISGVSAEYEEMETAQCMIRDAEGDQVLVVNASGLTPEQVLNHIENHPCIP